jgi:hypothetical protein
MVPARSPEAAPVAAANPAGASSMPPPDPIPPGRTRAVRTWPGRVALGAIALAILMTIAVAPYLGFFVLFVVVVAARAVWRTKWRLNERRIARGVQRRDHWVNALGTPWDLVVVALPALAQCLWVSLAGYGFGAAVAMGNPNDVRGPYLLGGVLALLLLWFGPGTARFRYGVYVLAAPIDRSPRWAWTVGGVFLALTWVLVLIWDSYGTSWAPGSGPPNPLGM